MRNRPAQKANSKTCTVAQLLRRGGVHVGGAADHYKSHGYEVEKRKGKTNELELACT
jgi:hypothetical protein